jgi:subtilisin family serine protease
LNNTGQNGGTPNADIDAPEGWDVLTSASNIVVAVLDTGVRYTHEDLADNMWSNPADGSHGTNALAGTTDPSDDSGHGTMIAGILGAVGNNGKGVTGVAWRVQIMACKCFNNFGVGSISSAVACLDYSRVHGARIINASWGFTNSLALSNADLSAQRQHHSGRRRR